MQAISFKRVLILFLLIFLAFLYKFYNPVDYSFFPKCPFLSFTGYKCPGCGSQRAIHHLLNFEFHLAISQNLLLVFSIPYLLTGFFLDNINFQSEKLLSIRKFLFGKTAIYIILALILVYWLIRNLLCYNC